jgi:hypothetical protein
MTLMILVATSISFAASALGDLLARLGSHQPNEVAK